MPKFKIGNPGGPGRPRGSRNAFNQRLDQLASESGEALVRAMVEAAAGGDCAAARLVLNRIWSAPKRRADPVELPEIRTPQDLVTAHAVLARAVADGTLTAQDAAALSSMLDSHRRAFELQQHEERVERLEGDFRDFRQKLSPTRKQAPLASKRP